MASEASRPPIEGRTPSRVAPYVKRRRRRTVTLFMCTLVVFIFCAKVANYAFPEAIRFPTIESWISGREDGVSDWYATQPRFHTAPQGQRMAVVPGGFVYTSGPDNTMWTHIFNTSPLRAPGGKPAIYEAITSGSVAAADSMLSGRFVIPRYEPATISAADQWRADPYESVYWRFYYYSLRPTVSLLAAYETTHDRKYVDALLAIDRSFFLAESTSPYAWQDNHAVAFRAMVLTYQWWELRRLHVLSLADSTAFLRELSKTGDFLADPNHYQPQMNHGTNESAALLQLGVDFPDLSGATTWLSLARTRLAQSLALLIDGDGVLIENSPYYHFYELDKFWQIDQFSVAAKVPISPRFSSRLHQMINYATYILQPDLQVPLLGASLSQTINKHGSFAEMARDNPAFDYVLTQGRSGATPAHTSIWLRSAGQSIFRSGWGEGPDFVNGAYLTFDVGPFRTLHSHLDALGFTLYDNGAVLLPDAGLYTYRLGPMYDYFHGTASHNTVVVDGRSQREGTAVAGELVRQCGITYQSGFSGLYEGVSHLRTVMMLNKDHFLVIDRLASARVHTYRQMFHLSPGAKLRRKGLTLTGVGATAEKSVTIEQLDPAGVSLAEAIGQTDPPLGLYSVRYGAYEPNYALSYIQRGREAAYTTLISVGPTDPQFSVAFDKAGERLVVHDHGRVLRIDLGRTASRPALTTATDPKAPTFSTRAIPGMTPWSKWTFAGDGRATTAKAVNTGGRRVLKLTVDSGTESASVSGVRGDLSRANLHLRIRVTNAVRLDSLTLALSNRGWSSSTRIDLRDSYTTHYSGEWMTISLGRDSSLPGLPGHWQTDGGAFDWRHIDSARISISASAGGGQSPEVEVESIGAVSQQLEGAVLFCFDDGYESVLRAAPYLNQHDMPANVAVIGRNVRLPSPYYLNAFDLRMLQDKWGWNIVNHTEQHRDALVDYYPSNKLREYEQDITDGAVTLEQAGLNSAPNWFINPHGTTNGALDRVVGRLYKFARTIDNSPEAYPFGSRLRVKTFEVRNAGEGTTLGAKTTPPADVLAAARDAVRYHTPLILTFHRVKALPSDRPGYPIKLFKEIVDGIGRIGIRVMSLSQLDALNGVPEDNKIVVRPAVPPMTTVAITDVTPRHRRSFWSWLTGLL